MDELLERMSPEEKELLEQMIAEFADGNSNTLMSVLEEDYEEIPVDIETFIKDRRYLGNAWYDSTGRFTAYPYWMETYKKIFPDNLNTNYNEVLLSGATGIGKSETAVTILLYMLYRVLCLKDPYAYFNLKPTDEISFGFLNITLDAARGVAWQKCQTTIQKSPWFLEHGEMSGRTNLEWQPSKGIKLLYGSRPSHVLGKACFCFFLDEVSFKQNSSVLEQQKQALELYNAVNERMKSRFISGGGLNPTMMIMASSKRTTSSFLETYIDNIKSKKIENVLIIDEPRYVIRPAENYSGKKFAVAVGNKFLASEIIDDNSKIDEYIKTGHTIIWVPIEEKKSFLDNIDDALTNVAGISSSAVTKFIAGTTLTQNIDDTLKSPFSLEILQIGTQDQLQIKDFFNSNLLDDEVYSKPIFIHVDTSLSGDKTGISAISISGTRRLSKDIDTGEEQVELSYRHLFSIAIKAPPTQQISLEKTRLFIYYLKGLGWNIKGVSYDGFQSADSLQILTTKGFITSRVSADMVKDRQPYVYNTLRAGLTDKRIRLIYGKLLFTEIVSLEKDNHTGKIDHPKDQSKDISDSLACALYNASQYKGKYIYYYGEDLETTLSLADSVVAADDRQQVLIDMNQALIAQANKNIETKPETKPIIPNIPFGLNDDDIFIPETLFGDIIVF